MQYHVLLEITDNATENPDFSSNLTAALIRAATLVDGVTSTTVTQVGLELQMPSPPAA